MKKIFCVLSLISLGFGAQADTTPAETLIKNKWCTTDVNMLEIQHIFTADGRYLQKTDNNDGGAQIRVISTNVKINGAVLSMVYKKQIVDLKISFSLADGVQRVTLRSQGPDATNFILTSCQKH